MLKCFENAADGGSNGRNPCKLFARGACKSGIRRSSAFIQFDSHSCSLGIDLAKLLGNFLGGFLARNSCIEWTRQNMEEVYKDASKSGFSCRGCIRCTTELTRKSKIEGTC